MNGPVIAVVVLGGLTLAALAMQRPDDPHAEPEDSEDSVFPRPIAIGPPEDSAVTPLLEEMAALFQSEGVDLGVASPLEVTRMPKLGQVAIPPRSYWPRMARTLREVFMPIRSAIGVPLVLRGYRAPDYNVAVGGAPRSRHQAFEALDIRIASAHSTVARRRELARIAANLYRRRGHELKMGLGVYGYPNPGSVHVDAGFRRRTWADAKRY